MNALLVNSHIEQVAYGAHCITRVIAVFEVARVSNYANIDGSYEVMVTEFRSFHAVHQEVNKL